ncbi:MAG: hypothetical protein WD691_03165, partial [Acidimicrobiales bacterium]
MALSEKHRSSIYQHLAELLGDEEADALLSQFPARDLDEPVTKDFVRAEIADIRTEVGALRGELHNEIGALRGQLHNEIGALRGELADRFRQLTMWMTGTMITGLG